MKHILDSPKSFNLITKNSETIIFCIVKLAQQAACEVTQMEERSAMCKLSYICELSYLDVIYSEIYILNYVVGNVYS